MLMVRQENKVLYRRTDIPARPDALDINGRVRLCESWLNRQGFQVLCIETTFRNPRITIRATERCTQLAGATFRYERVGKQERRYHVAPLFGCEVRWMEDGGEA